MADDEAEKPGIFTRVAKAALFAGKFAAAFGGVALATNAPDSGEMEGGDSLDHFDTDNEGNLTPIGEAQLKNQTFFYGGFAEAQAAIEAIPQDTVEEDLQTTEKSPTEQTNPNIQIWGDNDFTTNLPNGGTIAASEGETYSVEHNNDNTISVYNDKTGVEVITAPADTEVYIEYPDDAPENAVTGGLGSKHAGSFERIAVTEAALDALDLEIENEITPQEAQERAIKELELENELAQMQGYESLQNKFNLSYTDEQIIESFTEDHLINTEFEQEILESLEETINAINQVFDARTEWNQLATEDHQFSDKDNQDYAINMEYILPEYIQEDVERLQNNIEKVQSGEYEITDKGSVSRTISEEAKREQAAGISEMQDTNEANKSAEDLLSSDDANAHFTNEEEVLPEPVKIPFSELLEQSQNHSKLDLPENENTPLIITLHDAPEEIAEWSITADGLMTSTWSDGKTTQFDLPDNAAIFLEQRQGHFVPFSDEAIELVSDYNRALNASGDDTILPPFQVPDMFITEDRSLDLNAMIDETKTLQQQAQEQQKDPDNIPTLPFYELDDIHFAENVRDEIDKIAAKGFEGMEINDKTLRKAPEDNPRFVENLEAERNRENPKDPSLV